MTSFFADTHRSWQHIYSRFQGCGMRGNNLQELAAPVGVGTRPGIVGAYHTSDHGGGALPLNCTIFFAQHMRMGGLQFVLWFWRYFTGYPTRQDFYEGSSAQRC